MMESTGNPIKGKIASVDAAHTKPTRISREKNRANNFNPTEKQKNVGAIWKNVETRAGSQQQDKNGTQSTNEIRS